MSSGRLGCDSHVVTSSALPTSWSDVTGQNGQPSDRLFGMAAPNSVGGSRPVAGSPSTLHVPRRQGVWEKADILVNSLPLPGSPLYADSRVLDGAERAFSSYLR